MIPNSTYFLKRRSTSKRRNLKFKLNFYYDSGQSITGSCRRKGQMVNAFNWGIHQMNIANEHSNCVQQRLENMMVFIFMLLEWQHITVTSHESHGVSNYRQPNWLFQGSCRLTIRKCQSPALLALARESAGDRWAKSWRHHGNYATTGVPRNRMTQ